MSHEVIFEVLGQIAMAESMAYWIVAALTALVFVIMRAMLPVKGLSVVLAPGIFWGGLTGIYVFRTLGFSVSSDKSSNLVATATIGMIVAMLVLLVLVRLVESAMRVRTPLSRPTPVAPASARSRA